MENNILFNISKIIERDSKSTTYKFALLRGVIDIIQDNSPYITIFKDRAHFPMGLLIEKWLLYYYPILESSPQIPQINGATNLAFEVQFRKVISAYKGNNGFSTFYNDLKNKGIPKVLQTDFSSLTKRLCDTITKMPMKYIGRSISDNYYSIFQYESGQRRIIGETMDVESLISGYGSFSIPLEYYDAFKVLGSFVGGRDSILFKWAEFSVNASGKSLSMEKVVSEVLKSPITERDIAKSKELYKTILKKSGKVHCVWTGKEITTYDIDHVIPFSIWKNNDLWNLLPAQPSINKKKRDKIPSGVTINKRKDLILEYWELMSENHAARFQKEIQVALLGNNSFDSWRNSAISQLQNSCDYLISYRGYEGWSI